jgi:hypothetical protein
MKKSRTFIAMSFPFPHQTNRRFDDTPATNAITLPLNVLAPLRGIAAERPMQDRR